MTIYNYDGIVNARANGGADDPIYFKTTNLPNIGTGNWGSLLRSNGNPGSIIESGGNNGSIMDNSNSGAIPLTSPGTSMKKYLQKVSVSVPSINGISVLYLIDVVWLANYSVESNPGAVSMPTLTRYTSGKGLKIGCAVSTNLSAITPTVTVTYDPADGDSGTGHTATTGVFPSALIAPRMMPLNQPELSLAGGDTGVKNITNVDISATGTGAIDIFLYKPLAMIPTLQANSVVEWDGFVELDKDSVTNKIGCLGFLALVGGTAPCATQMAMLKTVMG